MPDAVDGVVLHKAETCRCEHFFCHVSAAELKKIRLRWSAQGRIGVSLECTRGRCETRARRPAQTRPSLQMALWAEAPVALRPATPVTGFVSTSNTRTQNNTKDVPSGVVASWTRAAHVSSQVRTCQRKNFVGWHCGQLTIDHYLYILITEPALCWAAVLHVTT